jgi:GntR family transcriptional regulator
MNDFEPNEATGYVYEQMYEHLAARIESGNLAANTPLPSERRLAQEYGVSLGTARHATRLLRYRGLVVTIRSKGTYIADRSSDHLVTRSDKEGFIQ